MAEDISVQRTAKLEALLKRRFTPEGKSERVAEALRALQREQPIKLSPDDWKWVAEDADAEDQS